MTTATLFDQPNTHHSAARLVANANFKDFCELFSPSEQDKKFTKILTFLLFIFFALALGVSLLEQVEIAREVREKVPVQLAKIILKEKQLPIPEKPKKKVEEEPKKSELDKPKNIAKEKPKPPQTKREVAKQKAKTSGLAAMKDELFAMREAFDIKPSANSTLNKNKSSEVSIKRKLLAGQANKQSSVLTTAKTSRTVKSDELSTRNTKSVRLSEEEILTSTDTIVEGELSAENGGMRSEMTLRRTLEAHKSRLYARYNRALRKDPFLQGKVLFEIEIQPSGKISKVSIQSSELNNPKLERQLVVILRSITFPKEDVAVMTTIWAIDFLPN